MASNSNPGFSGNVSELPCYRSWGSVDDNVTKIENILQSLISDPPDVAKEVNRFMCLNWVHLISFLLIKNIFYSV